MQNIPAGLKEKILEIIKDESERSNVRQYTCYGSGFSQFERNIADMVLNLFETKKEKDMTTNIPTGLIPYNHEKYLTGKYIAETRGGFRPDEVVYLKGSSYPLIYLSDDKNSYTCKEDGSWVNTISDNDLFLRPKTVKKYAAFFTDDPLFETKEECERRCSSHPTFLKAVEVEVNEE